MAYKIALLFWIIIGLGYLVMIMGFINQGMRHKKLHAIEHMLSQNLKKTPHKIREEIRALLHDILLTRVKQVYREEMESHVPIHRGRSSSCPDLQIYRNMNSPTMTNRRKRAFSESTTRLIDTLRIKSESELDHIDKERTFQAASSIVEQSDLLLRVVNALGNVAMDSSSDEEELGVVGFSEQEILASEKYSSGSTLNTLPAIPPRMMRSRACSEVQFSFPAAINQDVNYTWYGSTATKNLEELRENMKNAKLRQRTLSVSTPPDANRNRLLNRLRTTFARGSKEDRRKSVDVEKQDYLQKTENGRGSVVSAKNAYLKQTNRGRVSVVSTPENYVRQRGRTLSTLPDDPILEHTSIAELFRILTGALDEDEQPTPRRKLGTASLTPPSNSTPGRTRRLPIRTCLTRSSSLLSNNRHNMPRRYSLMPIETITEQKILSTTPPPPYTPSNGSARSSIRAPGSNRRFSLRPVTGVSMASPIQRQLMKTKEKEGRKGSVS